MREEPARGARRSSCASGRGSAARGGGRDALIVACEGEGDARTSAELAAWMLAERERARRDVAFVIGGAYGLSPAVRAAASRDCRSRASLFRTSSRDSCSRNSSIAPARSCAASPITSERSSMRDADGRMTEPKVLTIPFGGPPLARATLAGTVPAAWCAHAPRGSEEWRARARAVLGDASIGDWASALAPALQPTGAAARRLARSAKGAGVVVTTGQQPGLFGGPVYTWSKALSALALADAIEQSTGIPTAPVFWAATDDADFVEASASYVILNGDLLRLQQPPPSRPVSRCATRLSAMSRPSSLARLASGSAVAHSALDAVRDAYAPGQSTGHAYVQLLRALLEPLGIAVLDAGHPAVRPPHARSSCARSTAHRRSTPRSARDGGALDKGFEPPVAHVPACRPCSGTATQPSRSHRGSAGVEEDAELEANVLLRPVVERAILPTVAYVAGPGEIAYFAQATAVAEALGAAPARRAALVGDDRRAAVERLLERYSLAPEELRDPHAAESRSRASSCRARFARRSALASGADGLETLSARRSLRATARSSPTRCSTARGQIAYRIDRLERRVVAAAKRRERSDARPRVRARVALSPGQSAGARAQLHPLARAVRRDAARADARAAGEHAAFVLADLRGTHRISRRGTPKRRRRPRERSGRQRRSSRPAFCSAGWSGSCASTSRALPRRRAMRRTRSTRLPHSELTPESVRRGRALGVVHSRVRASAARATRRRTRRAWPAPSPSLLAVATSMLVLVGIATTPVLIARDRAGVPRGKARAHDHARADSLPRRRAARALGVVPRRSQQPPPVPAVVLGADRVERRDDRRASCGAGDAAGSRSRRRRGVGVGGGERGSSCSSSCRR